MAKELLNLIMHDGSRQFGELPQNASWYKLRDHIGNLNGAKVTDFVTDNVTEAWIDFTFRGSQFSVNDQFGDYWFFVKDPYCPDDILHAVLSHCRLLLGEERET
jgi:hypothetical protein